VLGIVWERDWLVLLDSQLQAYSGAVREAAGRIAAPWWRR